MEAYKHAGVDIPRTTFSMQHSPKLTRISKSQLQPGDLIFPDSGHVTIFLGGGKIIEAPHTGVPVHIINEYTPAGSKFFRVKGSGAPATTSSGDTVTAGAFPGEGIIKHTYQDVKALGKVAEFLADPNNWIRLAEFVAGGIIAAIAIILLLKDTRFGDAVKKTAKQAKDTATSVAETAVVAA
jgi:hypothetical protein